MKKIFILLMITLAVISVLSVFPRSYAQSQGEVQAPPASPVAERFQMANQWLNENNLSITTSPEQAIVGDYILVAAEGLPSPTARSKGQKRLTAERAATALAYRQLAEILDGVAVVGDTLVKDMELQYDVVRTAVSGFIKGAQIVYKEWSDNEEVALVMVKVGMSGPKGFGNLLYEKLLKDPKIKNDVIPQEPSFKTKVVPLDEVFDGLIVDARDVNFRPALINRIFTPKGEVIYDPAKISQKVLVEQGCGEYTNSVEKAKSALEQRGVKNPLVVKATGTVSSSDLQVSDEDAVRIYSANQKSNFLPSAKVAFVLR